MRFRLLLLGLAAMTAQAQPSSLPAVTLSGTLQTRFSYGQHETLQRTRIGFGVRRARLRVRVRLSERWTFRVQLDGTAPSARFLDAYAIYTPHARWSFRIGRMPSIQPRALGLTSHRYVDAVERPAIAERWGARTIGRDGRDFGVEAAYHHPRGRFILFLHNGDGSWDRLRGNYRASPSNTDVTEGQQRTGIAVSLGGQFYLSEQADIEAGGFVSYNSAGNPNTDHRRYLSYGFHWYWGAKPGSRWFRLKLDGVVVRYEPGQPVLRSSDHLTGIAGLSAVRLHRGAEAFARLEWLEESGAEADRTILTTGFSISPSALQGAPYERQRLTVAYATERGLGQHLLVVQWQLIF
ncbi:porin [Rhodothermus profundi]|uniref:porin n=1 Tax=Rhodothermus profundi TaxID=633813 RepID=UPI000933E9F6|nr:porin [Rhodothermus profundi]